MSVAQKAGNRFRDNARRSVLTIYPCSIGMAARVVGTNVTWSHAARRVSFLLAKSNSRCTRRGPVEESRARM